MVLSGCSYLSVQGDYLSIPGIAHLVYKPQGADDVGSTLSHLQADKEASV